MPSQRSISLAVSGQRRSLLRRFVGNESGSIAVVFSLIFVALALLVGGAVDMGRWLQARNQTASAMDAAVLAGARTLQLNPQDVQGAIQAAQRFYAENTKGRTEVFEDAPSFKAINNNKGFTGTSHPYIKTAFLGFASVSKLPLDIYSEAALPDNPLEISLMLDVTGSMRGNKIEALKLAAADLVNIVIPEGSGASKVRVSLVPFAEGVRLPTSANVKARGTPIDHFTEGSGWNQQTYYSTDCVVERKGANKYTDVAPSANNYVMTLYLAKDWSGNRAPCGLPAADEVVPLTNNKNLLKDRIKGLVLSGSTAGQIGTAWAWYTLSPNWNELWNVPSAASAYDSGTLKIAILMTDGEYNLQYNGNGVSSNNGVNGDSTTQARALCTEMKKASVCTEMKKKVNVYTIGFALGGNKTAIDTLNHCASASTMAYTAESGDQLRQAFRAIALEINQLYLTQ